MRRVLSILLVLFFGLGPLLPTLGSSDDLRLPPCCRRQGAHHCAMSARTMAMMTQAYGSMPTFTAPATCPLFPGSMAGPLAPARALIAAQTNLPVLPEQVHSPIARRTDVQSTPIHIRSGRAPPVSIPA